MPAWSESTIPESRPTIQNARVISNTLLCREHYRLTLGVDDFSDCAPGQFVQLSSAHTENAVGTTTQGGVAMPLLPRAFSVGGLRRSKHGVEIDVIYRVVGVGTGWMASLRTGDAATVLGPLGRRFPIPDDKNHALLAIGGVGLPPLRYLAEHLRLADKRVVAYLGAQSKDLLAVELDASTPPTDDARLARYSAREFAELEVPCVISTDDGSLGFRGNVIAALSAHIDANPLNVERTILYTCGPERMMRAAAEWANNAGIACSVCLERPMACGMGTCQSCIVTVRDDAQAGQTRYALCCTEGPVFDADQVVWD